MIIQTLSLSSLLPRGYGVRQIVRVTHEHRTQINTGIVVLDIARKYLLLHNRTPLVLRAIVCALLVMAVYWMPK